MSAKAAIGRALIAGFALWGSTACAQSARSGATPRDSSAIAQDSTKSVHQFVQGFYKFYTSVAAADVHIPAAWKVLSADRYLDKDLANALRGDSIATVEKPETRVTLDFDPFLSGQDQCGTTPRVIDVRRKQRAYRATVLTRLVTPDQTTGPSVEAEVLPVNGGWRITNVFYGEGVDLKSFLCGFAKKDLRPDRRPTRC
jgi:hypothetical protein